ncbi:hypothetical protein LMH73_007300 [Vibrio splendidus]|nr:hypothetical protein [Vibrio splendidus]MCC4880684.1 hypothetical protein [Vibrio splendidus]
MNTNKLAATVMSSTIIYCATVAAIFAVVYAVVLTMNPLHTTNVIYLKSLGFVTLILILDDAVKYIGERDKWAMVGLVSFASSLLLVSMLPQSLLSDFSMIEAAGLIVTPLVLVSSLFKKVNQATKQIAV